MTEEIIKEIAYIAWQAAANAHRMYPENKHTFGEFWRGSEAAFKKYQTGKDTPPCPKCGADETFENNKGKGECAICEKQFKI